MATFSVVATPIGNLEDMTFRAVRTLKEADLVLCEDTRVTRTLLNKYDVATPTESFHARSSDEKIERVIGLLEGGKNLALVTDAGTPGISDPGSVLVSLIRRRLPEVKIVAVPGASALTAALSIAGIPGSDFTFLGFLPHKKGRETLFREITACERTVVFYESPHRIGKTLESLATHFTEAGQAGEGGLSRKIALARELTKMYEEVLSGSPVEVQARLAAEPEKERGEFVVIVYPAHMKQGENECPDSLESEETL